MNLDLDVSDRMVGLAGFSLALVAERPFDGRDLDSGVTVKKVGSILADLTLLLVIVWLIPFAILLIGAPIASVVRLLIEIAQRL